MSQLSRNWKQHNVNAVLPSHRLKAIKEVVGTFNDSDINLNMGHNGILIVLEWKTKQNIILFLN